MNKIITKNFPDENTQRAVKEIFELIEQEKLSIAEIKGAALEALLMVMKKPLGIKNTLEDSMSRHRFNKKRQTESVCLRFNFLISSYEIIKNHPYKRQ